MNGEDGGGKINAGVGAKAGANAERLELMREYHLALRASKSEVLDRDFLPAAPSKPTGRELREATEPMKTLMETQTYCPHCGLDIEQESDEAQSAAEARAAAARLLNNTGEWPFNIKLPLVYGPEIKMDRGDVGGDYVIRFRGGIWLNDFIDAVDDCQDRIAPDDYPDMAKLCSVLLEKKAELVADGEDDMIVGFRKTIIAPSDGKGKTRVSMDFY